MDLLRARPRSVGEIVGELPITQPAVSQHLKVLRDAGLVTGRPDGTKRVYQLAPDGLAEMQAHLNDYWSQALAALRAAAENEGGSS
jgi:DNA-binding transcriptional ArsR family regulator